MTLSDLLYLCALLAATIGVAILVAAFLGIVAAIGAALVVASACLWRASEAFAKADSS